MTMRSTLLVATILLCVGWNGKLDAQNLPRTYQPSRPTTSPYLNLLRTGEGPLPNYQSVVRPQLQQQRFNREAQRAIEQSYRNIDYLAQEQALGIGVEQGGALGQLRVRQSAVRPTGVASQYQYFSHYYASQQQPGGIQGGLARPQTGRLGFTQQSAQSRYVPSQPVSRGRGYGGGY